MQRQVSAVGGIYPFERRLKSVYCTRVFQNYRVSLYQKSVRLFAVVR